MGFLKKVWNTAKDAAVLTATGGLMDSHGNLSLTGLGPGGTATNLALGDKAPEIDPTPAAKAGKPEVPANGGLGEVYANSPGLTTGIDQGPAAGLNMMAPGAAETYYSSTSGAYTAPTAAGGQFQQSSALINGPGAAETYATNMGQRYGNGAPQVTQNAQQAYDEFRSMRPSLQLDPGLGAYYDNAKRRAAESIDAAMAARGAYGSSAAMDRTAEAFTDLEAERALHEADYGLKRADTMRGFGETAGNLARGADLSSGAASKNDLDWMMGLGDVNSEAQRLALERGELGRRSAEGVDQGWINQLRTGSDVAHRAQDAQRQRGQDFFNNTFDMGNQVADFAGATYADILANDQALLDAAMAAELGLTTEALNQDNARSQKAQDNFEYVVDTVTGKGLTGGGRTPQGGRGGHA